MVKNKNKICDSEQTSINSILDLLADPYQVEDDNLYFQIILLIEDYYKKYKRYHYHEVTKYMLRSTDEETEQTDFILDRLDTILNWMESKLSNCSNKAQMISFDKQTWNYSDFQDLYAQVFKLYDHVKMELYRQGVIRDLTKQQEEMKMLHKKNEASQAEMMQEFDKKKSKLEEEVNKLNDKEKDLYLQLVTILGVFTSIVFAVFGGFGTILESLSSLTKEFSIEQVKLVVFSIAFVVFNIVFVLVIGLRAQYRSKRSEKIRLIERIAPLIVVGIIAIFFNFICMKMLFC